jgi:hypothetical protein
VSPLLSIGQIEFQRDEVAKTSVSKTPSLGPSSRLSDLPLGGFLAVEPIAAVL